MRQDQHRTVDAIRRVRDFLDDHADRVGGPLATSTGRTLLDSALAQLEALGTDQGTANLQMAGQRERERSLVIALRTGHMRPIATFARARLRDSPTFAALAKALPGVRPVPLVAAARAMAIAATSHADALTQGGFPVDTIAQLHAAADAVSTALFDRASTKVRRISDTRGIREQTVSGREALAMLHALLSRQFVADPTFLAGWRAARRVQRKLGGSRMVSGA